MVGAEAEEEAQALRQAAADQAAGLPGIVNNVQIAEKGSKRYLFISGILLHWQPRPPQDLFLPRPLWGLHRQPPGLGLGYVLVGRIVSMSAGPTRQTRSICPFSRLRNPSLTRAETKRRFFSFLNSSMCHLGKPVERRRRKLISDGTEGESVCGKTCYVHGTDR